MNYPQLSVHEINIRRLISFVTKLWRWMLLKISSSTGRNAQIFLRKQFITKHLKDSNTIKYNVHFYKGFKLNKICIFIFSLRNTLFKRLIIFLKSQIHASSFLTRTFTTYGEEQFYAGDRLSEPPRFLAINIAYTNNRQTLSF